MKKVCVVITARPSYCRIRPVLRALRGHVDLQLVVVASALLERYGRVLEVIEADGFEVSATVYSVLEGETTLTTAKSTGVLLLELASTFYRLRPDLVVTIADRHETLATAIAASYQGIPLWHVQGGELSGAIDDKVRNAVSQLADVHCVATEQAQARILAMTPAKPTAVHRTGCPSIDEADAARDQRPILSTDDLGGVGPRIDCQRPFAVMLYHPAMGESSLFQFSLLAVALHHLGYPTIGFWPGQEAGSGRLSKLMREYDGFHMLRNLPPQRFLRLLTQCAVLVGNSSVGIRESSFLGVPVVNIGSRQQGRERGPNVRDVEECPPHAVTGTLISEAIRDQWQHGPYPSSTLYGDGRAGARMATLLRGEAAPAWAWMH